MLKSSGNPDQLLGLRPFHGHLTGQGREGVPLASFGLSTVLGYGDKIGNRVVDAIRNVSGNVCPHPSHELKR